MSILRLLLQNLRGGSVTLPFPERPPIQGAYRGLLQNQPEECTGCGLCAYICTSGAVSVERNPEGFKWTYKPGQCTFCARCVQRCPKHSLSMEETRPPVYAQQGELNTSINIKKKKPAAVAAKPEPAVVAAKPEPAGTQ
jgi:formate hydrogenlyase subunit 6/NADH:ubiquinone oxidoreductase subunit I